MKKFHGLIQGLESVEEVKNIFFSSHLCFPIHWDLYWWFYDSRYCRIKQISSLSQDMSIQRLRFVHNCFRSMLIHNLMYNGCFGVQCACADVRLKQFASEYMIGQCLWVKSTSLSAHVGLPGRVLLLISPSRRSFSSLLQDCTPLFCSCFVI